VLTSNTKENCQSLLKMDKRVHGRFTLTFCSGALLKLTSGAFCNLLLKCVHKKRFRF